MNIKQQYQLYLRLSKKYPDHVFTMKITRENSTENLISRLTNL